MGPDPDQDIGDISPHVRIRIKPEKKQKWLQYADDQGLSLTDLIKDAVDSTIDDEWVLASQSQDESTDVDINLGAFDDNFADVLDHLESIESQLDEVALSGSTGTDEADSLDRQELISLANKCHEKLPRVPDGDALVELTSRMTGYEQEEVPMLTGAAEDIAGAIDEPTPQVRKALIFLEQEQHANISSIIHKGIRRWYEVDPHIDLDEVIENVETDEDVEFQSGTEFKDD